MKAMKEKRRLVTAYGLLALLLSEACSQSKGPPSNASGGAGTSAGAFGGSGAGGSGGTGAGGGNSGGGNSASGNGGSATGGTGVATGGNAGASMSDAATGIGGADAGAAAGATQGQCSQAGGGPSPPAGFTKADPIDPKFPFSTHFMGIFSDNPACIGMGSMSDLDNDGDEDFSSGQRDVACTGRTNPGAPILWWEYCTPDHWVRHVVGTGYKSAAGGGA